MTSPEETASLQEKYEKVRRLLDEDARHDPVTEPYRSKYKAQGLLDEMKTILVNRLDKLSEDHEQKCRLHAMLGIVWLNMGTTSIETEEHSTGEEQLNKCVQVLQNYCMDPVSIVTVISALNQLGLLWSERDKPKEALHNLQRAESLYQNYDQQKSSDAMTVAPNEIFSVHTSAENGDQLLEKCHTHTLYYLAQIYSTLGEPLRAAIYCHNTLKRQLESRDYDPIDWALNAATLSQFFTTNNGFYEARHHLAAASVILERYEEDLNTQDGSQDEKEAKNEVFRHRSADLARCWAKYGLNLLSLSRARLLRLSEEESALPPNVSDGSLGLKELASQQNIKTDEVDSLTFPSLEPSQYESNVTAQPVSLFDDARVIFLDARKWLEKAESYYTMHEHASDAVEIAQDHSRLFQNLIFFEDSEDRQCCMHKKRVDILEEALNQLNPQYYMPVCRQMWFELAEIYTEMIEIKKQKLCSTASPPTSHAVAKINKLSNSGIRHLNHFLESLHKKGTNKFPEEFAEELVRPALLAFFYLGKLYREVTCVGDLQTQNLKSSIDSYQFVVEYCDKHDSAREQMKVELGISREMLELLKIKLARLIVTLN